MQEVNPIGADAVHVCVDMQDLFAGDTAWHTPSIPGIVPNILRLAEHRPDRTVFTRFTTPERPEDAKGHWKGYYRRWSSVTTSGMDPAIIDVMAAFRHVIPPARVADKPTYSAFRSPAFCATLDEMGCATVVCTGVETDVCVLATVMSAMDRGYRVVVVSDACHGSNPASHEATMAHIYRRFEDQIEIGTTDEVIAAWTAA
ncbi:MAG: cysteine hydrolase [Rhodospirillales bacterium]|nr:cysteine hydrolase [Rhodospirillales bacterium]